MPGVGRHVKQDVKTAKLHTQTQGHTKVWMDQTKCNHRFKAQFDSEHHNECVAVIYNPIFLKENISNSHSVTTKAKSMFNIVV